MYDLQKLCTDDLLTHLLQCRSSTGEQVLGLTFTGSPVVRWGWKSCRRKVPRETDGKDTPKFGCKGVFWSSLAQSEPVTRDGLQVPSRTVYPIDPSERLTDLPEVHTQAGRGDEGRPSVWTSVRPVPYDWVYLPRQARGVRGEPRSLGGPGTLKRSSWSPVFGTRRTSLKRHPRTTDGSSLRSPSRRRVTRGDVCEQTTYFP